MDRHLCRRGNGDYRDELASALQAITTYLKHFALSPDVALVRLDGQYGDAVVIAQLMLAGVYLVTRGRGYQLLEHPQIQRVLAHPPTASVTANNTGVVVDLFEGGWLELGAGLPHARVIVARHPAPPAGKKVRVGKRVGEWVYELFITTVDADGFLVEDVLDLYHGRGAFEAVLADEDVEEDPDRWCSYTECGQELWQIACQWVWNLRLTLGKMMQGGELREMEWAPPTETAPLFFTWEDPPEEYGPWQCAGEAGRATGRFTADAFTLQENGRLRCPAGASLWLSEVRQENAFTQRAVYLAYQTDCLPLCSARAMFSIQEPKAIVRVESVLFAVSCPHLPLLSASLSCSDQYAGWMWQVDHFVEPGSPTGVGNMWRCFPWLKSSRRPSLLLVHPVPCVRIIAGVGRIGSHATPGGDHRNSVSLSLAFLLFSL